MGDRIRDGMRKAKSKPSLVFTNLTLIAVPVSLSGNERTVNKTGAINKNPLSTPLNMLPIYANAYKRRQIKEISVHRQPINAQPVEIIDILRNCCSFVNDRKVQTPLNNPEAGMLLMLNQSTVA